MTANLRSQESPVHIHPPKFERFQLTTMTNIDAKKIVRSVDEYRVTPAGLYMFRHAPHHHLFDHVESWLLPSLDLRVTQLHWFPEYVHYDDFYLDIAIIDSGDKEWQATDLYLD